MTEMGFSDFSYPNERVMQMPLAGVCRSSDGAVDAAISGASAGQSRAAAFVARISSVVGANTDRQTGQLSGSMIGQWICLRNAVATFQVSEQICSRELVLELLSRPIVSNTAGSVASPLTAQNLDLASSQAGRQRERETSQGHGTGPSSGSGPGPSSSSIHG